MSHSLQVLDRSPCYSRFCRKLDGYGSLFLVGTVTGALRAAGGLVVATLVAAVAALYFGAKERDLTYARDLFAMGSQHVIKGLIEVVPGGSNLTGRLRSRLVKKDLSYQELFATALPVRALETGVQNVPQRKTLGQRIRVALEPHHDRTFCGEEQNDRAAIYRRAVSAWRSKQAVDEERATLVSSPRLHLS